MDSSVLQRSGTQGPIVLHFLGGGCSGDLFLYNQQYVLEMIKGSLGKIYPYLNFSEILAVVDRFSELKRVILDKGLYESFNHINGQFFPELNKRKRNMSNAQKLKLRKLDVYKERRNLAERVDAISEELREDFRTGVMYPSSVTIETKVPVYKKRGQGGRYAKIRATEISNVINTFPREYFLDFC